MKAVVFGATGGCGSQVLVRLLERGTTVTAVVRSDTRLPSKAKGHALLTVVTAPNGHLELSDAEWDALLHDADAIVSVLGHNLTLKGIFGGPHMLCTDSVRRVCEAATRLQPPSPKKLIVVSTVGVSRVDGADPKRTFAEKFVIGLLSLLLPPMSDNVGVVDYLARKAATNPHVEFCAPRPSAMIDGPASAFTLHSTLQNGIFSADTTRRANVGEFMADLVTKPERWAEWKNSFPTILDVPEAEPAAAA